jgi:hypothetical protein
VAFHVTIEEYAAQMYYPYAGPGIGESLWNALSNTCPNLKKVSIDLTGCGNEYAFVMTLARIPLLAMYGYKAENFSSDCRQSKDDQN